MAVKEPVKICTAEDLWELSHSPEYADKRLELVEGELVIMSPAGGKHGGTAHEGGRHVGNFVDEHQLGYVTAAETGYILFKNPNGKDTVRAPDVGFISHDRLPNGLPDGYIDSAPDLAIEVVSPNDSATEVHDKVTEYLKYGTRFVWVFYPKSKSAVAHTLNGSTTLTIDDELDGGDVLPGFKLPLRKIFRG